MSGTYNIITDKWSSSLASIFGSHVIWWPNYSLFYQIALKWCLTVLHTYIFSLKVLLDTAFHHFLYYASVILLNVSSFLNGRHKIYQSINYHYPNGWRWFSAPTKKSVLSSHRYMAASYSGFLICFSISQKNFQKECRI